MNILISGSTGFVGTALTSHLSSMLDFNTKSLNLRIPFANLVTDQCDVIIHLAGKAHDLKKSSNEKEYFIINTELTKSLFDLFLESKARDFIYFSSVKAAADTVDEILFEDAPPSPQTPYGKSKLMAEDYISSKELPKGKRAFIIRPCMIHGPGNKGNLNLLYKVVKKGIPYPLAAFDNKRSFLSIQNLNHVIEKIITNQNISGGVYNISDDDPLSTNQVIRIIAEAEGNKPRLWRIHQRIVKIIANIGDKLHLPLNSERLKKLTESYVVSNDKIKQALKIDNLPVSSREGLLTTIRSFRSN